MFMNIIKRKLSTEELWKLIVKELQQELTKIR